MKFNMVQQSVSEDAVLKESSRPRLLPRIDRRVNDFLNQNELIFSLVDKLGSPLNVIFPDHLQENLQSFQSVYQTHNLKGRIYYVTKPCKSHALIRAARNHEMHIEVSSSGSLNVALQKGWSADKIAANGPKSRDYIIQCLKHDISINIDSFDEFHKILELKSIYASNRKIKISVRLSGFLSSRFQFTPHDNTFGIHIKDLNQILDLLLAHKETFQFRGFTFHNASTLEDVCIVAIENTLRATMEATKRGIRCHAINIGGGFGVHYAQTHEEWASYIQALKDSVLNKIPPQTWNKTGLGFRNENGILSGGPMFMEHMPPRAKGDSLEYIVTARLPEFGNARICDLFRDFLLDLDIEPGRSMMDQCGVTLGRVSFNKESIFGESLCGLEMNRSNIQSVDQKMLTNPHIIYKKPTRNPICDNGVYYVGNLCLSYDMIQYNKTYPELLPMEGDLVAFVNTAGYLMDFVESETLMQPVAKKVAVYQNQDQWYYCEDEDYDR